MGACPLAQFIGGPVYFKQDGTTLFGALKNFCNNIKKIKAVDVKVVWFYRNTKHYESALAYIITSVFSGLLTTST